MLRSAALTGPRQKPAPGAASAAAIRRVDIAPVALKGGPHFQFAYRDQRKVTHQNLPPAEAAAHVRELLSEGFSQALLHASDADYHLTQGKNGRWSVRRQASGEAAAAPAAPLPLAPEHNRRKNYLLPDAGVPIPFLVRLGVMTESGQVIAAKYDKFRQINRFLEMVADVRDALPADRPVRVVDFGSGKSYLTFALYHYLRITLELDVTIVGLDLRQDLVAHCNAIAADVGWSDRLRFEAGDIAGYGAPDGATADMVVSLHACDTATDDALGKAVAWGASVILSVPCCQHELFRQIENPEMRPLLKHGILKERLAALVTDALRAEMLERQGYQVQVLEFIDLEHTPKNLLLRAVRRQQTDPAYQRRVEREYQTFRDFWHAHPHIEQAVKTPYE